MGDVKQMIPLDLDGGRTDPGQVHTEHARWQTISTLLSADGAATDLAVTMAHKHL